MKKESQRGEAVRRSHPLPDANNSVAGSDVMHSAPRQSAGCHQTDRGGHHHRRLCVSRVLPLVSGIWYLVYCTSPIAYPIVNGYSPSGTWGPRTSTGGFGYSPSGARAPVPLR